MKLPVRRAVAAVLVAGFAGLGGAAPAAAAEAGWFERGMVWLVELWAGPGAGESVRGAELKGMGLDPNGGVLPPPGGDGSGNPPGGNG
ncbi:MAG TPA: hypothetical protein DD490_00975 [Acidobacteria bacterium]|nr:hypothetical protein [Acidobacteriota bacterium]